MAFYDKFPYTNFQELNLDWIVQRIKNIFASEAHTEELAAAAAENAGNAEVSAASAELSKNNAAQSATSAQQNADMIEAAKNQIYVNTERINNLIFDGQQTQGNSELIDIRVAYDGKTFTTAGGAVRGQVSELHNVINPTYAPLIWEQGSITNGVDVDSQYRARIKGYIPVNKGDRLVFFTEGGVYQFAYSLIGTNFLFREVIGWVAEDTVLEIPAEIAYIRINAKKVPDVIFDQTELDEISHQLYVVRTGFPATEFAFNKPKNIRAYDPLVGQDCTMVNDKLWIFYDSAINSNLYKLDLNTEEATTSQQHLGHCNSVDYNPNNKCLLVYKTSTANDPQAIIYRNPENKADLTLNDADCTIVNLYNNSAYLNPTASICWGENDNIIYLMDGVYDNNSNNHSTPNITIKKILLGMGANDLSSQGYGVFVSGKPDTEYNGTCKVLKTYNGSISENLNAVFNPANKTGTAQGMEYDGDIYIAWGFSGHNFLQIRLHDDSDSYEVVRNFYHYFTDAAGTPHYLEPEMLALNGDKIICGSNTYPYVELVSFNRN